MTEATPTPTTRVVTAADYDPFDPGMRKDPYPFFAALRRESPVHQLIPNVPVWAVSRYDDVLRILHDPETFSSTSFRMLIEGSGIGPNPNSGALAGHRLLASDLVIAVDPPAHGRLRQLVNRGFTPRRIAALEPRLREIAEGLVDDLAPKGEMDFVRDFTIPFPVTVIAELLGVDAARRDEFKRWSDTIVQGLGGTADTPITRDDLVSAADEMAEYLESVFEARRAEPRDDLISVLVAAEANDALTDGELLSFTVVLLLAGNETTTNLLGNALRTLLDHPDQLAEVQAAPRLIPQMIEEVLRFESPLQGLPRRVTRDVELAGTKLPEHALVTALFASANRDPAQFPDPDRFDVHRAPQGHLAFGHGIHFCLGASLARLEARVAFETLLSRVRGLRLETDEVEMLASNLLRGPASLPVSFEAP